MDGFAELAEVIERHIGNGEIVHVMDGRWPVGDRFRYTLQWTRGAGRVFDGLGRSLGVFVDLDALIAYAERVTA